MSLPNPAEPKTGTRPADRPMPVSANLEGLRYEIVARRKDAQELETIGRFKNGDDARATLWAVVFTGQYAEVQIRHADASAPIAEWPAGLTGLRCTS
jgi:hypothetical protein